MSAFWGGFAQTILDQRTDERKAKLAADLQRDLEERRQIFQQIQEDTRTMARRDERAMDAEWQNMRDRRAQEEKTADREASRKERELDRSARSDQFDREMGLRERQLSESTAMRKAQEENNALYRAAQSEKEADKEARREYDKSLKDLEAAAEKDNELWTVIAALDASNQPYGVRAQRAKEALSRFRANRLQEMNVR